MFSLLLIDNYDSFVFNIVGLLQRCRAQMPELRWTVVRNDCVTDRHLALSDAILFSPGPGLPSEAGLMMDVIRRCSTTHPMLGICLGCQAIAKVFGGSLRRLQQPRHGHSSTLHAVDSSDPIVGFLADTTSVVGRYHSWVIDPESLTPGIPLAVTSRDDDGNIMSIRHRRLPVFGLQFHPESIITARGFEMLQNFLREAVRLTQHRRDG